MLARFVVKNVFSFKDATEFNLFPNKTQRLNHHKVSQGGIDVLRVSALYGANGSGKSNLIKAVALLQSIVEEGALPDSHRIKTLKFKLDDQCAQEPISLGIEFLTHAKNYYYAITFDDSLILSETLVESKRDSDVLIFERTHENGKQKITFFSGYTSSERNKLFVDILSEKLLQKDEPLISFMHDKFKEDQDFQDIVSAYDWFNRTLIIIHPNANAQGGMAHLLDVNEELNRFANEFIPALNTGISELTVDRRKSHEMNIADTLDMEDLVDDVKGDPDSVSIYLNRKTGDEFSVVYENDEVIFKSLVSKHRNAAGALVPFDLSMESDGTRRLIDYVPAFNGVINKKRVYLIDEMERSLHPIVIKEILKKFSLDESAKGQLIFTTHESCLLDQEILRADEIWFAQKDVGGESRLYSLSDFNIHNTANIENGYLNGRYGGIPFLSSLHDLKWL